ncbi:RING-H2 finger protein ATL52-like [Henckelia pumila]|uniref:RING-H2 finger protein ATL52-like n=1 Tax=Henckelia pumila TaxID=405737 RepID=UPI003C6DBB0C
MSSIFNPSRWDPRLIGLVGAICGFLILFRCYEVLCRSNRVIRRTGTGSSNRMRRINEQVDELSSQYHSRGLSSYTMDSLPITQIKKTSTTGEEQNQGDVVECAVCLGEFEEDEWVKHLPVCSHVFHVSCIDTWFQTHSSCPLCRSFVDNFTESTRRLPVSRDLFLETLDREDFHRRQRSQDFQDFQFQILHE